MSARPTPLVGFAAYSGTGKTTLLRAVLGRLEQDGVRVAVVKHAHHNFDLDTPGKDSYELRKAGAKQMLISSGTRWALMTELRGDPEPTLEDLVSQLDHSQLDLVIVEGFKFDPIAKLELRRTGVDSPPLYPNDPHVIAIVCDKDYAESLDTSRDVARDTPLAILDINNPDEVTSFLKTTILGQT